MPTPRTWKQIIESTSDPAYLSPGIEPIGKPTAERLSSLAAEQTRIIDELQGAVTLITNACVDLAHTCLVTTEEEVRSKKEAIAALGKVSCGLRMLRATIGRWTGEPNL